MNTPTQPKTCQYCGSSGFHYETCSRYGIQTAADAPGAPQRLPANWHDCEVAEKQILDLQRQRDQLLAALKVLVDHAKETYPHFESERGQRDIAQADAAIANAESQTRRGEKGAK